MSKETQYMGGFVLQPKEGIYKNIVVLDFHSLYPSIIISHNISPETYTESQQKKNKVPGFKRWFLTKPEGKVPKMLKKILKNRAKIKKLIKKEKDPKKIIKLKKREQSLKLAANITYGKFAFPRSEWYHVKSGESISAFGRHYLKRVISQAEKNKFKVIYGDTDSVFLQGTEKKAKSFLKKINRTLPGVISLEFRGVYKKGIFVVTKSGRAAKKKYALMSKNGKLTIRGFEAVRGDWCKLAKETQYKVLEYVLRNENPKKAIKFVRTVLTKLKNHKYPLYKLILSVQLSRPLKEYKATGPHIAVAHILKKQEVKIEENEIIEFIITKGKGRISDRAIPAKDASLEKIDIEYYTNNQIIPSALRVLSVFDVKESDLK